MRSGMLIFDDEEVADGTSPSMDMLLSGSVATNFSISSLVASSNAVWVGLEAIKAPALIMSVALIIISDSDKNPILENRKIWKCLKMYYLDKLSDWPCGGFCIFCAS